MNALTTAASSIRRSPYQAFAAILTMTFTFAVLFCLSFIFAGVEKILAFYETKPQVVAFFKLATDDATVSQVTDALKKKPYVADISVTGKDEALKLYSAEFKDSPLLLELVTPEMLPISIEVSSKTLDELKLIKKDLESEDSIEDVKLQENVIDTLKHWTGTVRWLGIGIGSTLIAVSSFIIMVIISMRVSMQRHTISIMRLIGASYWYVKKPFVMEGMIYGLVGALFGWGISLLGLLYSVPYLETFTKGLPVFPIPTEFFAIQGGIGLTLGLILGGFSGLFAASRLIRQ